MRLGKAVLYCIFWNVTSRNLNLHDFEKSTTTLVLITLRLSVKNNQWSKISYGRASSCAIKWQHCSYTKSIQGLFEFLKVLHIQYIKCLLVSLLWIILYCNISMWKTKSIRHKWKTRCRRMTANMFANMKCILEKVGKALAHTCPCVTKPLPPSSLLPPKRGSLSTLPSLDGWSGYIHPPLLLLLLTTLHWHSYSHVPHTHVQYIALPQSPFAVVFLSFFSCEVAWWLVSPSISQPQVGEEGGMMNNQNVRGRERGEWCRPDKRET